MSAACVKERDEWMMDLRAYKKLLDGATDELALMRRGFDENNARIESALAAARALVEGRK